MAALQLSIVADLTPLPALPLIGATALALLSLVGGARCRTASSHGRRRSRERVARRGRRSSVIAWSGGVTDRAQVARHLDHPVGVVETIQCGRLCRAEGWPFCGPNGESAMGVEAYLSAVVGAVAVEVFRLVVLPLIPTWWPGGPRVPRVKGKWLYDDGTLQIWQFGTRIRARAARTEGESQEGVRYFNYKGEVVGGQLVLTWEQSELEGYSMGAMVLTVSDDGKTLEGMTTYLQHRTGTVISRERKYTRDRRGAWSYFWRR